MMENQMERVWDFAGIDHQDHSRSTHIKHNHHRYQGTRHVADAFDPPDKHNAHNRHHRKAADQRVNTKRSLHGRCHRVRLHAVANTKTSNGRKNRKHWRQDRPEQRELFTHTLFEIIHRATHKVAFAVDFAKLHRAHRFSIFGRHAQQGNHPHVE